MLTLTSSSLSKWCHAAYMWWDRHRWGQTQYWVIGYTKNVWSQRELEPQSHVYSSETCWLSVWRMGNHLNHMKNRKDKRLQLSLEACSHYYTNKMLALFTERIKPKEILSQHIHSCQSTRSQWSQLTTVQVGLLLAGVEVTAVVQMEHTESVDIWPGCVRSLAYCVWLGDAVLQFRS